MKFVQFLSYQLLSLVGVLFLSYARTNWNLQRLRWKGESKMGRGVPSNGARFDFVVVGAGVSGSAVAARLAGEGGADVLLLEAGAPANWMQGIPGVRHLFHGSKYDWRHQTEESDFAGLAQDEDGGGKMSWPRGRQQGGSAMLGQGIHLRGRPGDYDEWEIKHGAVGWGYVDLLPHFKRSEGFRGRMRNKADFHGTEGPISVVQIPTADSAFDAMCLEAAREVFNATEGDLNGERSREGNAFFDKMQVERGDDGGWSAGPYSSYVEEEEGGRSGKGSVTSVPFATVKKVRFDGRRATGVEVNVLGRHRVFHADKEVILSAGVLGSPHLLMASGVGDREHLNDTCVSPIVAHLPRVGGNLADLPATCVTFATSSSDITDSPLKYLNPLNYLRAIFFGGGPLVNGGLGVLGLVRSKNEKTGRPDLEIRSYPFSPATDYGSGLMWGPLRSVSGDAYDRFFKKVADANYTFQGTVCATLLHPVSRGRVLLKSKDVERDRPEVEAGYLVEDEDALALAEGVRTVEGLQECQAFKKHDAKVVEKDPECDRPGVDYYDCYVRHWTAPAHAASGTCAIGAVVDARLRVSGLEGLRVADASVMPAPAGAHAGATCAMIGEMGAHLILQDWGMSASTRS